MAVTIRTRRLRVNKVLSRKELTVEIYHEGTFSITQANLTSQRPTLAIWFPKSTDGIVRTLSSSDWELLSVEIELSDSHTAMTTISNWSSSPQITSWEEWKSFPREILREKLKKNSKGKSRNPEDSREEKYLPPEK